MNNDRIMIVNEASQGPRKKIKTELDEELFIETFSTNFANLLNSSIGTELRKKIELENNNDYLIKYMKYQPNFFKFDEENRIMKCVITIDKEFQNIFINDKTLISRIRTHSLFGELFSFKDYDDMEAVFRSLSHINLSKVVYYVTKIDTNFYLDTDNLYIETKIVDTYMGDLIYNILKQQLNLDTYIRIRYFISKNNNEENSIIAIDLDCE